jgi:beta-lactamase superfamily II metal-dependent hydrolase
MKDRIGILLIGLLGILLILAACTNGVATTKTSSVTRTVTQTVTEPVETVTVTTTITTDLYDELKVHFIDVGQGDAILIDLDETEILIDGGGRSPGVVTYVDDYIDGTLEVMVATHPHADHIGGLIEVLNNFQVGQIWHNGDTSTSQTYAEFMNAVQSDGAEVNIARRGDQINMGELTFIIFNPYVLGEDTNNNSIVLHLNYGEIDFLFTGDAEKEAENDMLVQSIVPLSKVEILKVGHHGSRTASSEFFLEFTHPETAIYMAKVDNSYGHPHEEALLALTDIEAEIYGTDIFGTITVSTDGLTYEIQTEKN